MKTAALLCSLAAGISTTAAFASSSYNPRHGRSSGALALAASMEGAKIPNIPTVDAAAEKDISIRDAPSLQQLIDWSMGFHDELKEAGGIISGFDKIEHWLDKDFIQTGPDIGPINLQDFKNSLGYYRDEGFDFGVAIPDLDVKFDGWHVDPHDPWRVWFVGRYQGTFKGKDLTLNGNTLAKANGQKIDGAPELYSYTFTPEGKIKFMTIGFVGDKYTGTNKGYGTFIRLQLGMGVPKAAVDLIYPFVQAQTWISQFQGLGTEGGTCTPPIRTPSSELPQWWQDRKNSGKNLN